MNALGYLLALVTALGMNQYAYQPALVAHLDHLASVQQAIGGGPVETQAGFSAGPKLDPNVLYAFG